MGAVRDYDVFIQRLRSAAARSGATNDPKIEELIRAARGARSRARARMADAMRSPRYVRLREKLVLAARAPQLTLAARLTPGQAFPPIVKRRRKRIDRAVQQLTARPSLASLHRIRILAKRLRYAAEAMEGSGCTATAPISKAAAHVQAVLGELNDAASSCGALRRMRARPELALAANAMLALEMEAVVRGREAWPAAWGRLAVTELPSWR